MLKFPRKRWIIAFHKWVGITSAVFLVILAVTGLALNHTERLALDEISVTNKWILNQYGMEGSTSLQSFQVNEDFSASTIGNEIFLNERWIYTGGPIIGTYDAGFLMAIVSETALLQFTPSGELIETVKTRDLPFDKFLGIGISEKSSPVFITDQGLFTLDSDWIQFTTFQGNFRTLSLVKTKLPDVQQQLILESYQGGSLSLYRVILDLHSGRLFGWGGRTLMDLSAIAMLLLVSSGVAGMLRKSRSRKEANIK